MLHYSGKFFTSDNVGHYDEGKKQLYLSQFPSINPQIKRRYYKGSIFCSEFTIGSLDYVLYFNEGNELKQIELPQGSYIDGMRIWEGNQILEIPPHCTRMLSRIPERSKLEVVGGNVHLFGGSAVNLTRLNDRELQLELHPQSRGQGMTWIKIPDDMQEVKINKENYHVEKHGNNNLIAYRWNR